MLRWSNYSDIEDRVHACMHVLVGTLEWEFRVALPCSWARIKKGICVASRGVPEQLEGGLDCRRKGGEKKGNRLVG